MSRVMDTSKIPLDLVGHKRWGTPSEDGTPGTVFYDPTCTCTWCRRTTVATNDSYSFVATVVASAIGVVVAFYAVSLLLHARNDTA